MNRRSDRGSRQIQCGDGGEDERDAAGDDSRNGQRILHQKERRRPGERQRQIGDDEFPPAMSVFDAGRAKHRQSDKRRQQNRALEVADGEQQYRGTEALRSHRQREMLGAALGKPDDADSRHYDEDQCHAVTWLAKDRTLYHRDRQGQRAIGWAGPTAAPEPRFPNDGKRTQ